MKFQFTSKRSLALIGCSLAVLVASGCPEPESPDDTGIDTGMADTFEIDANKKYDTGGGSESIEDLAAVPNPSNALSYYVEWTTTEPASTDLTVECGENWSRSYTEEGERTDHEVFVMGLWDGADCKMTAAAGEEASQAIAVDVGPLPDFLPDFQVHTNKEDASQGGWTLFNLTNPFDGIPLTVAMVDKQGRYRWYHQLPTSSAGADPELIPREKSLWIGGNRGRHPAYRIDWEGTILWKDNFRMHHDFRLSNDGKFLWVLQNTSDCPSGYSSEKISKYSRSEEKFVDSWSFCEEWEPPEAELENDWSHVNTIEPFAGEEEWLMSARDQHTIFKFDIADDEIDWKMGVKGDFGLSGDELFYRQHAPELQSNGNILLFDNGAKPKGHDRPWSRAVELSYDTDTMEAEVVWSYRPEEDIFAPIWGDADRLDNGNTLVTFGLRDKDPENNSHIIEVTADKEKVWHLEVANKWGWYRSDRVVEPQTGYVNTGE